MNGSEGINVKEERANWKKRNGKWKMKTETKDRKSLKNAIRELTGMKKISLSLKWLESGNESWIKYQRKSQDW